MGNSLGHVPLIAAVAFGIGALVVQSVVVFTIIKLAGAVYLVYLGVQAFRKRHEMARAMTEGGIAPRSTLRLLGEGFVVGVTNPKTIAFFVAVLPQFVVTRNGTPWLQMIIFGLVFMVLGVVCDSIWALAAGTARRWFASSPRRVANVGATGGVMMIGLGGTLAFTGAKS